MKNFERIQRIQEIKSLLADIESPLDDEGFAKLKLEYLTLAQESRTRFYRLIAAVLVSAMMVLIMPVLAYYLEASFLMSVAGAGLVAMMIGLKQLFGDDQVMILVDDGLFEPASKAYVSTIYVYQRSNSAVVSNFSRRFRDLGRKRPISHGEARALIAAAMAVEFKNEELAVNSALDLV